MTSTNEKKLVTLLVIIVEEKFYLIIKLSFDFLTHKYSIKNDLFTQPVLYLHWLHFICLGHQYCGSSDASLKSL